MKFSQSEKETWIRSLPKKRCAAGVILRNSENHWLLLKTNYHDGKYTFPGGIIEQYESIKVGAEREVFEETGIKIEVDKLLTITNVSNRKLGDELVIFYFNGGILSEQQINSINPQEKEILDYLFVPEDKVVEFLRENAHETFSSLQRSFRENKLLFFEVEK